LIRAKEQTSKQTAVSPFSQGIISRTPVLTSKNMSEDDNLVFSVHPHLLPPPPKKNKKTKKNTKKNKKPYK